MRRSGGTTIGRDVLAALGLGAVFFSTSLAAADEAVVAEMSPRILFTISGGAWQGDDGEEEAGYYRAVVWRAQDNTSRLYLQQIVLSDEGPQIIETSEIPEITELGAYVTDMRPENSRGTPSAEGFAAFIYLKRDPAVAEPEMWELFVDEFGEIRIDGASN